ncbi:MAG: hypothetical protein J7K51_10930 [Thermotogae bacterium]|nr:hypothetical protein [Thermotogota bacterium]
MKVRPIHHWKERRIKASMKSLKMVKMKVEEEDYLIRTEMKEETQALSKKLGIKTPKRITKM